MLILSRRVDESIVIGDEVVITILSVKGKQVRVGITAPPDVSVHREEIYRRIQSGEIDALSGSVPASAAPGAVSHVPEDSTNGNVASEAASDCSIDDNAGNR